MLTINSQVRIRNFIGHLLGPLSPLSSSCDVVRCEAMERTGDASGTEVLRGRAGLSSAQIEIVGQFDGYTWENSKLNFEEVARKELGPNPFPNAPLGRIFRNEGKKAFDREREN
jgi:hypothetical protein